MSSVRESVNESLCTFDKSRTQARNLQFKMQALQTEFFFVTSIRFTSTQFPLRATLRRIFENACNTKIAPSL